LYILRARLILDQSLVLSTSAGFVDKGTAKTVRKGVHDRLGGCTICTDRRSIS